MPHGVLSQPLLNLTPGVSYTLSVALDSTNLLPESNELDNLIASTTPTLVS